MKRSPLWKILLAGLLLAIGAPAQAAVKIVATTQDLASLATAVGGSEVSVNYIARGDLDPHFVDAKPSYMVKLASADMLLQVGMDLEVGWLPSLIAGARNPRIQQGAPGYVDLSTAITKIEVPTGTIDRSRGDLHPAGNPHWWLNPENGRLAARLIAQKLSTIDSAHSATYQGNLAAFEQKLTAKEGEWHQKMAAMKGVKVIGYHSTFDYMLDTYGLDLVGFVEPKPGIPASPSHTLELAATAKAQAVRFVVVEQYHNPRDAGPIASASGATVLTLPTSVGALDGCDDYFGLFDTIVRLLTT